MLSIYIFSSKKTIQTKEANTSSVFNMLQLFGGTPEGFVGFIIGKMIKNTQMTL